MREPNTMNYFLPMNYYSREESTPYIDGCDGVVNVVYQPEIYRIAEYLLENSDANYIIDIGCGDGRKLKSISKKNCSLILMDHENIINNVTSKYDNAHYIKIDFDNDIPDIDRDILSKSIVICSDVVEHLLYPDKLMTYLSNISHAVIAVIISTPDRLNERGQNDMGPPANPYHIREWSTDEFVRYACHLRFRPPILSGLTESDNTTKTKATSFIISGRILQSTAEDVQIYTVNIPFKIKNLTKKKLRAFLKKNGMDSFCNNSWYGPEYKDMIINPLLLRLSVEEHVKAADYNNYNFVTGSFICMQPKNKYLKQHGKATIIFMDDDRYLYVKGEYLNSILNDGIGDIKKYPFNLIGALKYTKFKFNLMCLMKKNINVGFWHENITRLNYIQELAFQYIQRDY